jgi:phospholipid transport system substrate-binding protein
MTNYKQYALGALFVFGASILPAAGAPRVAYAAVPDSTPLAEVKETVEQVVKISVTLRGDEHKAERREKLRTLIEPRFDFREMSQRSLGAQWNTLQPEQQEEFVTVFSSLLARTYLERIETVEEKMVTIDSEQVNGDKALVKTSVHRNGDVFPLDYKLMQKNGGWRVYDVVIENIGLVSNYRNEFAGIMRKEKFEGLITRLRDKNSKAS